MSSSALCPVRSSAPESSLSARFCGFSGFSGCKNSTSSGVEENAEVMPSLINTSMSPSSSLSVATVGRRLSKIPSGRLSLSSTFT